MGAGSREHAGTRDRPEAKRQRFTAPGKPHRTAQLAPENRRTRSHSVASYNKHLLNLSGHLWDRGRATFRPLPRAAIAGHCKTSAPLTPRI
ncbi:hypothetical protein NDU88_010554 [Pleurodeles waltl]|uniref:Uncharacterized protein n=1 Tax=Pleurodeles waltl TaxID=8319 RepID=A0AAV7PYQ2_PLEWA|nr:hypothetical protein NDU88_010554 [Pleurodeles waltl]